MVINFNVGIEEKHDVEFYFSKVWGNMYFKVDGKKVSTDLVILSASTSKSNKLVVGEKEKHDIEVVWKRPLALAGFRGGWKYDVVVDGVIVKSETD